MSILGLQVFEVFASYSTQASGKLGGKREKKWFSLFFDMKYVPIEIQLSLTNWRKNRIEQKQVYHLQNKLLTKQRILISATFASDNKLIFELPIYYIIMDYICGNPPNGWKHFTLK